MPTSIKIFGNYKFNARQGLQRNGQTVELPPKAWDLLHLFLKTPRQIITKEQIAYSIWPNSIASDDSISKCVYQIREALQDTEHTVLRTVSRRGFILDLDVTESEDLPAAPLSVNDLIRTAYEIASTRSKASLRQAHAALEYTRTLYPEISRPVSLMADIVAVEVTRGYIAPSEAEPKILQLTDEALAMDPGNPHALAVRGWAIAILGGKMHSGRELLDKAIILDPKYPLSFYYRAWVSMAARDAERALLDVETGLKLAPIDRGLLALKCWIPFCCGRTEEAEQHAASLLQLRPDVELLHLVISSAALIRGDGEMAISSAQKAAEIANHDALTMSFLALAHAALGNREKIAEILERVEQDGSLIPLTFQPPLHAALGKEELPRNRLKTQPGGHCPWRAFSWCDPRLAHFREPQREC